MSSQERHTPWWEPADAPPHRGGGQQEPPHPLKANTPSNRSAPAVDSASLLQGQRELLIHHQGQRYRLQATRQGKLILTK